MFSLSCKSLWQPWSWVLQCSCTCFLVHLHLIQAGTLLDCLVFLHSPRYYNCCATYFDYAECSICNFWCLLSFFIQMYVVCRHCEVLPEGTLYDALWLVHSFAPKIATPWFQTFIKCCAAVCPGQNQPGWLAPLSLYPCQSSGGVESLPLGKELALNGHGSIPHYAAKHID